MNTVLLDRNLAKGHVMFSATGVTTDGTLLKGVRINKDDVYTQFCCNEIRNIHY